MNDQTLFNKADQAPVDIDTEVDYWTELTGPGKKFDRTKYQSDEEMHKTIAKGKYLADQMVSFKNQQFDELNQDYLEMRKTATTGQRLSEILDRYDQQQKLVGSEPPTPPTNSPAYDPKEVESLFERKFEERETTRKQADNYNQVISKLKDRYGDSYEPPLRRQMAEMDMSQEDVNSLARSNPKAFMKMFGLETQQQSEGFQAPPRTETRFSSSKPERDWDYYQKLRRENPDLYRSTKTQNQMLEDYARLGKRFETNAWASLGE